MCVPSCFSGVRLFVILWTVARQAPLSMGFSRQEYWEWVAVSADVMRALQGALMFDSGTNLAAVAVVDLLSCLTLRDPMDCSLPGSSVHGIFQAIVLEGLSFPSPGDLPNPGIETGSPAL